MNTTPPAVTMGPPRLIDPGGICCLCAPPKSCIEPSGTCHRIFPSDCREQSPGWRAARQIRRRLQEAPIQTVRRASLVTVVAVFGVRAALIIFDTRNQAGERDDIVRICNQQTVLRVERIAAPSHAADVA